MRGAESELRNQRTSVDDAKLWRRFRGVPGEDVKVSTVHRLKLARTSSPGFGLHLTQIAPTDEKRGHAILSNTWRIGAEKIELDDGLSPWVAVLPSKHFADRLHRFDWLPDLFGVGGDHGPQLARDYVDGWIDTFGGFNGFAWRQGPTAARIWNWMRCGPALFSEGTLEARQTRLDNITRQFRHLRETVDSACDPQARWKGSCVLVAQSICLLNGKGLEEDVARLEAECTAHVLPDGGHVSRSPANGLRMMIDLLTLKDAFVRSERAVPDFFDKWINRLGGMVNFFRVPDGALNCFNEGDEQRAEVVEAALSKLEIPPRNFSFVPKSGYQKIERGTLRVVLDCGEAPPMPFGDFSHAGALGFEMSDGDARLITSCGCSSEVNVDWQAAVRRTGAHSTLVLGGRDSSTFEANEETGLLAPRGPEGISATRREESTHIWLDAQHSGYKKQFGLLHRRRMHMSDDGTKLRGEDALVRPVSQGQAEDRKPISFEIRFHLHPTVTAMMAGDSVRLLSDNGAVWRFKTSHENTRLERTVYLSRGVVERPEQIVLAGLADPNGDGSEPPNCVRWAFLKEKSA